MTPTPLTRSVGAGSSLRRLRCLAPLPMWLPRTTAPITTGATGAAESLSARPVVPWSVLSSGQTAPAEEGPADRPQPAPARPVEPAPSGGSGPTRPSGPAAPVPGRRRPADRLDDGPPAVDPGPRPGPSPTFPAVGLGPSDPGRGPGARPEAVTDPTVAAGPGGHAPPAGRDRTGSATPEGTRAGTRPTAPPDQATFPTPGRTPIDGPTIDRPAGSEVQDDSPRPSPRPTSRPRPEVADGVEHTSGPGGALGELVGRWAAAETHPPVPSASPSISTTHHIDDQSLDGNPSGTGSAEPATAGARLSAPTADTTAPGTGRDRSRRSAPRSMTPVAAPEPTPATTGSSRTLVEDEHMMEMLDAALSELIRRDAERHGLRWIDP